MKSGNFFAEMKRRNVYKVAVAYAVVAWLLIQVATQVFPFFEIPNWAVRLVVLAVIAGFPIALIIAWAFELTPQGIRRAEDVEATETRSRGVTWIYIAVVSAILSVALFVLGRYTASRSGSAETGRPAAAQSVPAKSIAILPFENLSDAPNSPEAHVARGVFFYWAHRQYDDAVAEFNRALELQPNNALAQQFLGWVNRRRGEWERSIADAQRAQELDPRDPSIPSSLGGFMLHCACGMMRSALNYELSRLIRITRWRPRSSPRFALIRQGISTLLDMPWMASRPTSNSIR